MSPASAEPPLRRALELARKAWGRTHPNPLVGAVITEGGVIVAEGYHAKAGEPHAEVIAIRALGRAPSADAVLHVTLEPCCTHGRTPPCVDAILKAGFRTVVIGALDPNPAHQGRGVELLRAAGVAVITGVLREECEELNLIFNHWITARRPFMALKVASTLDGKLQLPEDQRQAITGPEALEDVHHWRRYFPGIAVSANTLLADNPRLTSRLAEEFCPIRFVLDRRFRTAGHSQLNLYRDAHRSQTIVVGRSEGAKASDLVWFESEGIRTWVLDCAEEDFLDAWAERCAEAGITGVLIEGGPRLSSVILNSGFADYLFAYVAPRLDGDPDAPAWYEGTDLPIAEVKTSAFGQDALFRGYLG